MKCVASGGWSRSSLAPSGGCDDVMNGGNRGLLCFENGQLVTCYFILSGRGHGPAPRHPSGR